MEVFLSILFYIASCVVAYKVGQWSIISEIAKDIMRQIDNGELTREEIEQALAGDDTDLALADETEFKVERHDNCYYAYAEDDTFLAQGSDFKKLLHRLNTQYPGTVFRLSEYRPTLSDDETALLLSAIIENQHEHTRSRHTVE